MPNYRSILSAILEGYALPIDGPHGVAHWARVYDNGMRLAGETGARREVVGLFAVFHDSRRLNEHHDPGHGLRGAELAHSLLGELFHLADDDFDLLYEACAGHTDERTHLDVTVQTCWDADRLDLGRVGVEPHADYLCTPAAKRRSTIRWADGRASFQVVPEWVEEQWGVELE
ncbi:hypothetical protein NG895_14310 [Aeoliella sp. ICT_H6.2]|uniref:HD domain-containing protein n=1 Tax=Aeoliella straminimaris TaxID=2954799 RepID=A0A9X2F9W3_9BACT|nr:hypothetical protein [Aeoliella straminimaris]MCO6045080.1 hypothetical protein [Aeoliella straminimaris]